MLRSEEHTILAALNVLHMLCALVPMFGTTRAWRSAKTVRSVVIS